MGVASSGGSARIRTPTAVEGLSKVVGSAFDLGETELPVQRQGCPIAVWRPKCQGPASVESHRLTAVPRPSAVRIRQTVVASREQSTTPGRLGAQGTLHRQRANGIVGWPVDRLFSSYGDVIDAYREIIRDLPHDEQVALFSGMPLAPSSSRASPPRGERGCLRVSSAKRLGLGRPP